MSRQNVEIARRLDRLVADAIGRFLHGARPQAWATPQMPRRTRK
jgi:hypothetical protein